MNCLTENIFVLPIDQYYYRIPDLVIFDCHRNEERVILKMDEMRGKKENDFRVRAPAPNIKLTKFLKQNWQKDAKVFKNESYADMRKHLQFKITEYNNFVRKQIILKELNLIK